MVYCNRRAWIVHALGNVYVTDSGPAGNKCHHIHVMLDESCAALSGSRSRGKAKERGGERGRVPEWLGPREGNRNGT